MPRDALRCELDGCGGEIREAGPRTEHIVPIGLMEHRHRIIETHGFCTRCGIRTHWVVSAERLTEPGDPFHV